jgi:hypothetical protein
MVSTMLMYVGLLLVVSGGTAIALHHSVAARVARVPGDPVMVAGFARREPGGSVPHLYRDVPSTKLVVDAAAGHELVLATPDAARRAVGGAYRGGSLAVLIGVAMAGAGLLTQCWGP